MIIIKPKVKPHICVWTVDIDGEIYSIHLTYRGAIKQRNKYIGMNLDYKSIGVGLTPVYL
jgi:hypothetical protein